VDEIRVQSWGELQEALFAHSWQASIARFRSGFVFRGAPLVARGLETSLQAGGFVEREGHLLTSFRKYALRNARSWRLGLELALAGEASRTADATSRLELLAAVATTLQQLESLAEHEFVAFFEPPSLDERIINQFALFSLPSRATRLASRHHSCRAEVGNPRQARSGEHHRARPLPRPRRPERRAQTLLHDAGVESDCFGVRWRRATAFFQAPGV